MSKNKNRSRKTQNVQSDKDLQARRTRRKIKSGIWFAAVMAVLIGGSAIAINVYQAKWSVSHDLTSIGNGTPTIVQVHDPKCPKCKQLKTNTLRALKEFPDRFQFRIADITTGPGKQIQRQHEARIISLLMFDDRGNMKRRLSGVKDADVLEVEFDDFLARYVR